jgi:hypothetical protein
MTAGAASFCRPFGAGHHSAEALPGLALRIELFRGKPLDELLDPAPPIIATSAIWAAVCCGLAEIGSLGPSVASVRLAADIITTINHFDALRLVRRDEVDVAGTRSEWRGSLEQLARPRDTGSILRRLTPTRVHVHDEMRIAVRIGGGIRRNGLIAPPTCAMNTSHSGPGSRAAASVIALIASSGNAVKSCVFQ